MRRLISACAVWVIALGSLGTVGGVAFAKGAPLTKGEYVAQYNALCEASIGKTHAALEALGPHHNLDQLVHTIVPIYQHRLDKTRKLVPPTADRKKVKELVAAQQAAIDKVKDDAEVLSGGHIGQGPADTFRRSVGKQADKLAKTYVKTLEAIVKKAPSLKSMAETLPTSSKDALQTAGKSIGNAIDAIKRKGDDKVSMLDSSGMLSPDLGRCGGIFPL